MSTTDVLIHNSPAKAALPRRSTVQAVATNDQSLQRLTSGIDLPNRTITLRAESYPFEPESNYFPVPTGNDDRLLNAREVAQTLGVSERWVRDHTTRRSPKIRGIKLGSLIRYRRTDVESFMEKLGTQALSRQGRFGV